MTIYSTGAVLIISALLGIMVILANSSPAQAQVCDYDGTPQRDILRGTNEDDDICGYGGSDSIYARGGDDYIEADNYDEDINIHGDDYINSGSGNDLLLGGYGADNFKCGRGDDIVIDYYPIEDDDTVSSDCEEVYGENNPVEISIEQGAIQADNKVKFEEVPQEVIDALAKRN